MFLIVALVVLLILVLIAKAILDELELSPKMRRVAMLVMALLVLLLLVGLFTGGGSGLAGWPHGWRLCP